MAILAKNPVTGELTLIDAALPRDVALDLDAGSYEVLPVGDIIGSVNVLAVTFATAPTISGSATAGATLTVSGTAAGAVSYEYRWLADAVLVPGATSASLTTDAIADLGKTFIGEMRALDVRGRWTSWAASSNSITIPAAIAFTIPDNKWTGVEATADVDTRKTTAEADCVGNTPPTGALYWYKGTNPLGNLAQVGPMTDDGDGTFSRTSTSLEPLGGTVYVRLAYWNASKPGGAGYDWCSSVKQYVTSNVPAAPGAFTATNSTTITGQVSLDPNDTPPTTNGRAILEYGYSENGGSIVAFATGGTATTARSVDFLGVDARTVRLHARNVNGWSAGSASQTVTPPVVVAGVNTTAPFIDSNFYGQSAFDVDVGVWTGGVTSFVIDIEKSDNGTTGWTTHAAAVPQGAGFWPQTTLDAKYVRAKVTPPIGSAAYSAAYQMKDSPTHVINFTTDMVSYPVTAPLWGGNLTSGGVWFSFMYYYSSGVSPGSGQAFSFGDASGLTNQFSMNGVNGFATLSGTQLGTNTQIDVGGSPVDPQGQWYMMTMHWYAISNVHYVRVWRNGAVAVTNGATRTFSLAGATGWTTMRIGGPAQSTLTSYTNMKMCCFLSGTGDPAAFHADTFNNGKFRNPFDYNFATDPNGATKNFGVPGYRVGSIAYAASQLADTVGSAGTPTATSNAPDWTALVPPFVSPTGGAVPVQGANIRPLYAPAGTPQTFEYGYGKPQKSGLAASPWVTATSYAVGARVTQGGSTYICVTAHTSGTFATDLTAEKWAIFTINSLTHAGYAVGSLEVSAGTASLGNILPTVTNGIYTCTTPGTVTANVSCGLVVSTPTAWAGSTSYTVGNRRRTGTPEVWYECLVSHTSATAFATDLANGYWKIIYGTFTIVSKLYEPQTMPTSPRNAADYDGNGLLCAFDPYPTPAAAGTTFANVAALATGIGAVGSGGYLCVNNLTDTGTDLTIPAGDYGGAVIEAKNLHGVNVKDIFFHDVRNLTLRGFKGARFKSGGNDYITSSLKIGCDGIWIDHCLGTRLDVTAKVYGASRIKVRNWQTPTDLTATQHIFRYFLEAMFFKAAIGGSASTDYGDRLYIYYIDRFIADRVYVGPFGGLLPSSLHADLIQGFPSGLSGYCSGYFINSAAIDKVDPLKLPSSGALFFDATIRFKDFWINNFIGRDNTQQSISIALATSNVSIENSFGQGLVIIKSASLSNSGYADNNVKSATGAVIENPAGGTDINTTSLNFLGISFTTIYPQYNTYPLSWRALANPGAFYTTQGPATFVAELEAKRVALGI